MKKTILLLILLLFTLLPAQAVRKVDANPINVAVILTEQPDSASIASTCEYYGYVSQPSQDGYTVYQPPKGSTIRYKYTVAENGKSYPTIEVKSKFSQNERNEILRNLNFQKKGDTYERKAIGHQTRCSSAPQGYLRFSNHPKPKK